MFYFSCKIPFLTFYETWSTLEPCINDGFTLVFRLRDCQLIQSLVFNPITFETGSEHPGSC